MPRLTLVVSFVLACVVSASAQNSPQTSSLTSDPLAIALAQQSVAALTGGAPISDVTLSANVISFPGSENDPGKGTFQAKGTGESRVDLSLSSGTRSDVRSSTNGTPTGSWQRNGSASSAYSQHNCLTDAVWFFPALSSLSQTSNPSLVFKYVGQEQHNGVNTHHIQVFQTGSPQIQSLSTMDFYLDATSSLLAAVASYARSDNDVNTRLPNEIRFSQYQTVSGIQVPFHFQRIFNNSLTLDVSVTSASIGTGLSDAVFTLQ